MNLLGDIQRLQFTNKTAAEALLLRFMQEQLGLNATAVELRPLAVSLNSFNGFVTLDETRRLFFKTHTEPDGVIAEYYNAAQLARAGYPVLQPVYQSTEDAKQLLIYEVIHDPSVFDVAWAIENGDVTHFDALTTAQADSDDDLFLIYQRTLEWQTAANATSAPIHQLFHHRLAQGRFARFYGANDEEAANIPLSLPDGAPVTMRDVMNTRWTINGQQYSETLADLVQRALMLLQPAQEDASIIGHGDAHNGNVFFQSASRSLLYFDPAFAGRHPPLLDLAKPLFHNVFAMWMYFPHEMAKRTDIQLTRDGDVWHVAHDYGLPPVRKMFLTSKVERVLIPTLKMLKARGWLRTDWRAYLKAALFCCPLLTMNLADSTRFPPAIQLLGFTMAMEMGADSKVERSHIDTTLDLVEAVLL